MQYQSIPIKQANLLAGLLDSNLESEGTTPMPIGALRESQEQSFTSQTGAVNYNLGHSRANYSKGPHHRRVAPATKPTSFRKINHHNHKE